MKTPPLTKSDHAAQLLVLLEDEIRFREFVLELGSKVNKDENEERRLNWLEQKLNRCELEQQILRDRMEEMGD